jgi:hypothetical protein
MFQLLICNRICYCCWRVVVVWVCHFLNSLGLWIWFVSWKKKKNQFRVRFNLYHVVWWLLNSMMLDNLLFAATGLWLLESSTVLSILIHILFSTSVFSSYELLLVF